MPIDFKQKVLSKYPEAYVQFIPDAEHRIYSDKTDDAILLGGVIGTEEAAWEDAFEYMENLEALEDWDTYVEYPEYPEEEEEAEY